MEAPSWKHPLAVASLVYIIATSFARFLIPGFFSTPGLVSEASFGVAFLVALDAFFLPLLWWRTTAGYVGAVVMGIIAFVGNAAAVTAIAAEGALSLGIGLVIIPSFVFSLLLIGASVLAWRER